MIYPGPWFRSQASRRVLISAYNMDAVGKYGSQNPQRVHGGYVVASCANDLMARDIEAYPRVLRAYQLVRDAALASEAEILEHGLWDPQLFQILRKIQGPHEETPNVYTMVSNKWETAFNPWKEPALYISKLRDYKFEYLADCMEEFEIQHPFGKQAQFWK